MSPSKFYDETKKPSPLKINKDSHLIQKSPSSSSSSNSSTLTGSKPHPPPTQQRHPVIIYTHSPKIIHTKARDFMALVQKLTGLSRAEGDEPSPQESGRRENKTQNKDNHNNNNHNIKNDDTGSSSVITEENCVGGITDAASVSPGFDPSSYLSDVQLFAPTAAPDYFCSPRPLYRYPDHMFASPNIGAGVSAGSMLEVFKGYQDYCN